MCIMAKCTVTPSTIMPNGFMPNGCSFPPYKVFQILRLVLISVRI